MEYDLLHLDAVLSWIKGTYSNGTASDGKPWNLFGTSLQVPAHARSKRQKISIPQCCACMTAPHFRQPLAKCRGNVQVCLPCFSLLCCSHLHSSKIPWKEQLVNHQQVKGYVTEDVHAVLYSRHSQCSRKSSKGRANSVAHAQGHMCV